MVGDQRDPGPREGEVGICSHGLGPLAPPWVVASQPSCHSGSVRQGSVSESLTHLPPLAREGFLRSCGHEESGPPECRCVGCGKGWRGQGEVEEQ